MPDENLPTATSQQQRDLETKAANLYGNLTSDDFREHSLDLLRSAHVPYLYTGLGELSSGYASLDASRPWIIYWILHSLALLDAPLPAYSSSEDICAFLALCQQPSGGFGGGPLQIAHLAPTYAAVCSLVTLGTATAWNVTDRKAMYSFLLRMCIGETQGGGFRIHEGGEADVRACYTALVVGHMLQLDVKELVARSGMVRYLARCQTYEGGLGGEPGNEAHGGYTFCGVAALILADAVEVLDVPRLVHWLTARQGSVEGGFNGRTNKLVDGCYSFWQGGVFGLLQRLAPHYLRQMPVPKGVPAPDDEHSMDSTEEGGAAAARSAKTSTAAAEPVLVPTLSFSLEVAGPVEQAKAELRRKLQRHGDAGSTVESLQDDSSAADNVWNAEHSAAALCPHLPTYPLPSLKPQPAEPSGPLPAPLCNPLALQLWVLKCCQQTKGGLRDKPGKSPDFYHTCYCLSGLSSAQHGSRAVLGPPRNLLQRADPLCNVVEHRVRAAREFFAASPL